MVDQPLRWFAVRSVWRHQDLSKQHRFTYEERIVLFQAHDGAGAIAQAEREAAEYDGEPMDYYMCYELVDGPPAAGQELFSLMRDSDLSPNEYLDRFHDTGAERSSEHNA